MSLDMCIDRLMLWENHCGFNPARTIASRVGSDLGTNITVMDSFIGALACGRRNMLDQGEILSQLDSYFEF